MSVHRSYPANSPIPVMASNRCPQPMPGTPVYGIDTRASVPYSPMMNEAIQYAHNGVEPDCYGGPATYNNWGSPYPYGSQGMGGDYDAYHPIPGPALDEQIRRHNLAVALVNSQLNSSARYGQLQPMMCRDGRFPDDFRLPKTIEEVKVIDPTRLERILHAYGLPTDLRTLRYTSRDRFSPKHAQMAKLATLFDFLGATRLSDHLRRKSALYLPF
ncbi:hypothetical protein EV356DRAFT_286580 [Viridothelium virens]|uniref:Uncharacterized protein n=1 Tax=Viridothelium virens TaxID=1048519 RepID=A0A6A6H244_VIRVR|nr:hypothetical protein EV356DRAFT_286580 [Viridothelium virens]